ncbi:MAG: AraC family transcriptional regulator [Proteobacteria bacterium]|nr:AraC family transcriptional regulator [Pseudomonadota bacterium]
MLELDRQPEARIRLDTHQLDEFEASLSGVDAHYVVTRSTAHEWRLRTIDLGDIRIMLMQFGSDCVFRGAFSPGRFGLALPLSKGTRFALNSTLLESGALAWLAPGQEYHGVRQGGLRLVAISIDARRLLHWSERYPGIFAIPANMIMHANQGDILGLLAVLRQILHLETVEPHTLSDPVVRENACRHLLDAIRPLMETTQPSTPVDHGRPRVGREEIIRSVLDVIDQNIDEPIHLEELCKVAQVSERTLHAAFTECLGVSPHRYLMMHRLRAIHSAMLVARPTDTVASICAKYGIWDFGRFSAQYRRVFGTRPSLTLARARHAMPALS